MTAARAPAWLRRAMTPLLGPVAIYAALLPIRPGGDLWRPDLLYCLLFASVARAPSTTPVVVVLALGLLADLVLSRPLGLGALALLVVTELVRAPGSAPRDWGIPREWLLAALGFAAMIGAMTAILALSLAAPPALAALRAHVIATALAYPIVALLVRRLTAGAGGARVA